MSLRRVSRLALVAMLASALAPALPVLADAFTDVPSSNYYFPYVEKLASWNVVQGQNGMYRPADPLTRAELTKIVELTAGTTLSTETTATFPDVPNTHSLFQYVETAARGGIVRGYDDGLFRPDRSVSRGEASKIVYNTLKVTANTAGGPHFSDVGTNTSFYLFVESLYNIGGIDGTTTGFFNVDAPITRGEMAKLVVVTKNYKDGTSNNTSTSSFGLTSAQTSSCIKDRTVTKSDVANNIIVQAYAGGTKAASNQPIGVIVKVTDQKGRPVPGLSLNMQVTEGNSGSVTIPTDTGRTGVYQGSYTSNNTSGTIVGSNVTLLITERTNSSRQTGYEDVKAFPQVFLSFPLNQSTQVGSVSKICWDLTRDSMTIDPNHTNSGIDDYIVVIGTAEDGNGVPVSSGITPTLYVTGDNSSSVSSSYGTGGVYLYRFQPTTYNQNNTIRIDRKFDLTLQLITDYLVFQSTPMHVTVSYLPRV